MEINEILEKNGIIGVIGNYKSTINLNQKVKDLKIKNFDNSLKMVGLENIDRDTILKDLSISEQWKLDLATKLHNDIIIIGNIYNSLIYRDREVVKKLLLILNIKYNKKRIQ